MPKPKHFSWFKFEWKDWREDKNLRRCTKETRGFWIDCIAEMEDQDTYFLEGTAEQLCRDLFCSREEFDRSIADLEQTGAAEVVRDSSKSQQVVNITSRRLLKKHNRTEYLALAKRKEREKKAVNTVSTKPLLRKECIEKKDKKREEEESNTTLSVIPEISTAVAVTAPPSTAALVKELPIEIFFGLTLSGLARRMGVKTLPNPAEWQKHLRWAFANNFAPDDVFECYDLMKQQEWRDSGITPKSLMNELPHLNDLRQPPVPTGRNNGKRNLNAREERREQTIENSYAFIDALERQDEPDDLRPLLGGGSAEGDEIDLSREFPGTH